MAYPPSRIESDGDDVEKCYWPLFIRDGFPSYEVFWAAEIVPLTYRTTERSDIRFRTTEELAAIGRGDEDVTVAQLHYTALVHLGRVYDLAARELSEFDEWCFTEALVRVTAASDVADELLQRRATPGMFAAWHERDGETARRTWRKEHPDPLKPIRDYRNRAVHGRLVPRAYARYEFAPISGPGNATLVGGPMFPKVEAVDRYLDWREAFRAIGAGTTDFEHAREIARDVWKQTLDYVETAWNDHLIPAAEAGT